MTELGIIGQGPSWAMTELREHGELRENGRRRTKLSEDWVGQRRSSWYFMVTFEKGLS
jgi:hypothetical protein